MHAKLLAIKEAWDKELDGGRDTETANRLAREYVAEFPEKFTKIAEMPLEGDEGIVHAMDVFREAGWEENVWEIQAWLFSNVPPQNIGGNLGALPPPPPPAEDLHLEENEV
jgi:hypothetical protein